MGSYGRLGNNRKLSHICMSESEAISFIEDEKNNIFQIDFQAIEKKSFLFNCLMATNRKFVKKNRIFFFVLSSCFRVEMIFLIFLLWSWVISQVIKREFWSDFGNRNDYIERIWWRRRGKINVIFYDSHLMGNLGGLLSKSKLLCSIINNAMHITMYLIVHLERRRMIP